MKLILAFLIFGSVIAAGVGFWILPDIVPDVATEICKSYLQQCENPNSLCVPRIEPGPLDCPLKCHVCKETGNGVKNCSSVLEYCKNVDDVCGTQIEYNILGTDNIQTVKKGCITRKQAIVCLQPMALNTTDQFQFLLYSKCCRTNGCNSGEIEMQQVNITENGLKCPSCFVEDSLQCPGTIDRPCTGTQAQCLNFTGVAARPGKGDKQYEFKGCATIGACCVDLQTLPGSTVAKNATRTCEAAKLTLPNLTLP